MAGMLPGVEAARRRRCHQSGGGLFDSTGASANNSVRRSYFCLYASNHESHLTSTSSMQRSGVSQAYTDQKLNDAAREAKKRLDGRLRTLWKSDTKRNFSGQHHQQRSRQSENRPTGQRGEMIGGVKKSGSKRFSWAKLGWKSSEQKECVVCLEQFKAGENLMQLPCGHSFHSGCLSPWLDSNSHCPCCRMDLV